MNLDKFKEDIYKCSGCGQCQSACPIYKILKSECAVSRGKFKLLNAIVNREIKFSPKTEKIIDLCLNCGSCKEFCPANIDVQKIINAAKTDMFNQNVCNFSKKFLPPLSSNYLFMKFISIIIDFYRNSKILTKVENLNRKFFHNDKLTLINSFLKIKIKEKNIEQPEKPVLKIAYFKGCINSFINPSSFNAAKQILNTLNIEVIEPKFSCCGLALKNVGNIKQYKKIACKNLDLIPDEADYIVSDCASCLKNLKNYAADLEGSYRTKAENLQAKIISIYELLEKLNYSFIKDEPVKISYHNPCADRFNSQEQTIINLLKKSSNIKLSKLKEPSLCCGASFPFVMKHSKLSEKISKTKAEDIINSSPDIVLTSCPMCYIGLKQGLLKKKSNIEVMQVIEFLSCDK